MFLLRRHSKAHVCATEVVLAVLLGAFRFRPSGQDIVWNHAVVAYPTVGPTSETPSLPLKVELLP